MKKLMVLLAAVLLSSIVLKVEAQIENSKWKLNSLTLFTGETPLTKGITFTPIFEKGKSTFVLDLNAELGEAMYFYSVKKWFSVGPSIGFLKNTPWIGPICSFNLFKGHFKTLNWVGWSFGDPEKGTSESLPRFLFSYHEFSLTYKNLTCYYTLQHYQEMLPEHIVGAKATFSLNENFSLFGGLGYMTRAEKYLWSVGISYKTKK